MQEDQKNVEWEEYHKENKERNSRKIRTYTQECMRRGADKRGAEEGGETGGGRVKAVA